MCLYPRLILNKKYLPNRKNNYDPPELLDERVKYVAVGCGQCIECRKKKAREWQIRLSEELKSITNTDIKAYMVNLSVSEETYNKIENTLNYIFTNEIARYLIRHFLERWRKKYKKSLRHWIVNELGQNNTERMHFHGIVFCKEEQIIELKNIWQYGNVVIGTYCNERTTNYIVKYIMKIDIKHKGFEPTIFCSAGLGKGYIEKYGKTHKIGYNTKTWYTLPNGHKLNLPNYYRNNLWNDNEKEKLWIETIKKHKTYVCGIECDISTDKGIDNYIRVLEQQRKNNIEMGYGDNTEQWQKKQYKARLKHINAISKLQKQRKTKKS